MKRMNSMARTVKLTDTERLIFRVFLDTCKHFELKTTLRAAGGWVRDKLLDIASDDLDIAVDDGTGEEFADKVEAYAKVVHAQAAANEGNAPSYANQLKISSVGNVRKNPEQSKHLATACFRICGVSVDVTNLRTETYAEETGRIPVVEIGTPSEDAHRRDLTINSLFYNLHTESVEDFTNKGVEDLSNGFIRTPLNPEITFLDDPLRVLRVVRFACRYDFDMDPAILQAMLKPKVQAALADRRVSAERLGTEMEKIMKHGRSPVRALQYFLSTGCLEPIFLAKSVPLVVVDGAEDNKVLLPSIKPSGTTGGDESTPTAVSSSGRADDEKQASTSPPTKKAASPARSASRSWKDFVPPSRDVAWSLPRPHWWQLVGYITTDVAEKRLQEEVKRNKASVSSSSTSKSTSNNNQISSETIATVRLAALLISFGNCKTTEGKKQVDAVYAMLWKNLVLKKAISETAAALARTALTVFLPELEAEAAERIDEKNTSEQVAETTQRFVRLGTAMRERKETWKFCLFLAEAVRVAKLRLAERIESTQNIKSTSEEQEQDNSTVETSAATLTKLLAAKSVGTEQQAKEETKIEEQTDALLEQIYKHGLDACWTWTPMFPGDKLRKDFEVGKGPIMGELIKAQIDWRLEKPGITEDEVRAKLNEKLGRSEGGICGSSKTEQRSCCV
ncbi:unnamed protein product [Amoebophrya sp. A120]|nr:unnamed protein product [Amoebophrya sp. A120]|eukprot:GSA120T00010780001.1